jgi:quercetin dioxygenase-like cupin family protein
MKSKDITDSLGLPTAQAIKLADLVNFQDNSVVSRTLLKKKSGTITLFAFGEGQALSEHTVPFHAFVQVLDGEAEFVIGGKSILATAGQTVVMPANVPHAVNAVRAFKMLLTMIRKE